MKLFTFNQTTQQNFFHALKFVYQSELINLLKIKLIIFFLQFYALIMHMCKNQLI